jgi:hypothetical protein
MIKKFQEFVNESANTGDIKPLKEVDKKQHEKMLEVLPPIYVSTVDGIKVQSGFAVSEPYSETDEGIPTFSVFFKLDGKYYETEASLAKADGKDITFATYNDNEYTKDNKATSIK